MGWKKWYLIYAMCDESFTLNYAITPPDDVDRGWFMFFVTVLNHCYWVTGATLGALLGYIIHFNTKGIDFVMTILFVVLFIEQWDKSKIHFPAITGILCSISCLFVFGSQIFILPAMHTVQKYFCSCLWDLGVAELLGFFSQSSLFRLQLFLITGIPQ